MLHKSIIPTVWTPHSVPTACTTRLVDKLHNKSRAHMQKHVHAVQNRTIDARKTTQPSSTQSQIGTGKKDAHDKNTPEIAAWIEGGLDSANPASSRPQFRAGWRPLLPLEVSLLSQGRAAAHARARSGCIVHRSSAFPSALCAHFPSLSLLLPCAHRFTAVRA